MIFILSISEVLAMIFPVIALYHRGNHPGFLRPVKLYIIIACILNLLAVVIDKRLLDFTGATVLKNNGYIYNIHSIVRFLCFCTFFELLHQPFLVRIKKLLPYITGLFVIIIFIFIDHFFDTESISNTLFAMEAGVLLFYCLQYYLFKLQEDNLNDKKADFWVTTGLSIYVVFNFPFFLLYNSLSDVNKAFWWNIHNVSYIIFCIFIAKAFHVSKAER